MSDPFEILQLPRRPWLDPVDVRRAFQARARQAHPDAAGGSNEEFARLNRAQAELADPAARLRLLAEGAQIPQFPPDPELGFAVAAVLNGLDAIKPAESPLLRAVRKAKLVKIGAELDEIERRVDGRLSGATGRLRILDAKWPGTEATELASLISEFAFLQKWKSRLAEGRLKLKLEL